MEIVHRSGGAEPPALPDVVRGIVARFRFARCGDGRVELCEVSLGSEGVTVCRAVFERFLVRRGHERSNWT